MILNSIKYSEFPSTGRAWYLDDFMLGSVNLLVGKNASGKTRTISLINALANLVCGERMGSDLKIELLTSSPSICFPLPWLENHGLNTKARFIM
jgi:recombinational DNA repair ATPase RecF